MICYPNAKINIGLKILSKRNDGFHNLNSFFYAIPLCDVLEVNLGHNLPITKITYSGIKFPNIQDDLILKAYHLLKQDYNLPILKIHLHKNIPYGSGLGGGSSNATHMLILLNKMFDLKLNHNDLIKYSTLLGSDCPFFLYDKCCYVTGVGDNLEPILSTNLDGYYIVIVKPSSNLSTAEVFSKYQIKKNVKPLSRDIFYNEWSSLTNDLETVSFDLCPDLHNCKLYLQKIGAEYISMSGSGSAIYGIFKTKPVIKHLFDGWKWEGFI